MVGACSTLGLHTDIIRILMLTPGVMSAHYSIEFRTHFTKMHQTVIGFIGATEQLLFVQIGTFLCYWAADSNAVYAWPMTVPGIEYETNLGDIVLSFAFVTGIHFNVENVYASFRAADDKMYALGCLLPYA